MNRIVPSFAVFLLIGVFSFSEVQAQDVRPALPPKVCNDQSYAIEYWRSVRKSAAEAEANLLILPLADCLGSPNPELRDQIAYEVITYWLRNKRVTDAKVSRLRLMLIPWLRKGAGTQSGDLAFARAFSALLLSEVVRYDSSAQSMAGEEVFELHKAAIEMFIAERDYRGLTDDKGWIHTIAHGADLLWRLGMHPLTGAKQQREILGALAQQIVRPGIPPYTFNEGDRLARVVAVLLARDELADEEISAWIMRVAKPLELENWNQAFATQQGMAQLHNQKQFLRALKEAVEGIDSEVVIASLNGALQKLP